MTHSARSFALRPSSSTSLLALLGLSALACTVQTDDTGADEGSSVPDPSEEMMMASEEMPSGTGGSDTVAGGGGADIGMSTGGTSDVVGAGGDTSSVGSGGSHGGADPTCERGITNNAQTVCCPAACGFCGGTGCEDNPGGEAQCCAGEIGSSGVSCSEAEAPCALDGDDETGSGGAPGAGGSPGSGGSDPGECTLDTPVAGLPSYDFTMHNVLTKRMERKDFCDADKWYSEWLDAEGNPVQEFSLHQGDDMADYVAGGRSHQRCEFEDGLWATKGGGKWIEWEGRMLLNKLPENTITIGQMFGPNGPDARIEFRTNGSVGVGSLNGGDSNVTLSGSNNVGKSFKIKMRTNGDRVEVYFNGSKEVDRPTDGNNGQKWHFRWGVYSNDIPQEATPFTNTVTELVVSG